MDAALKVWCFVAIPTIDRLDNLRVRNFTGVESSVATHAGQSGVYGLFQERLVNKKLNDPATLAHGDLEITVAGQAVLR